jgi:hypothetical protein
VTVNYYIYYKVPPEHVERARVAVLSMQERVRSGTGISGRLLRRRDDPVTWMEIYENVADTVQFEAALSAAVASSDIAQMLTPGSSRKQEIFQAL